MHVSRRKTRLASVLCVSLAAAAASQTPLGTAFTYQGRLTDGGAPADGIYDFLFQLWADEFADTSVGDTVCADNVAVVDGLFTVELDFGAGAFGADERWLEIAVRHDSGFDCGGAGNFTALAPLRKLNPTPLSRFNASGLDATIGGGRDNQASAQRATVGGGYAHIVAASYGTVGGGYSNDVPEEATSATVSGGENNQAVSYGATVGGGGQNYAFGDHSTIGGGHQNETNEENAFIGGGESNAVGGLNGTIGGGYDNAANGDSATIAGGSQNLVTDYGSTVGGGTGNQAGNAASATDDIAGATVAGGMSNKAAAQAAAVGGGSSNVVNAGYSTISGGWQNVAGFPLAKDAEKGVPSDYATVGGGYSNFAGLGAAATVAGGNSNRAEGGYTSIGGGFLNQASADFATVGGGFENHADGYASTVPGGSYVRTAADNSFAAGTRVDLADSADGSFAWADASTNDDFERTVANEFAARAVGGVRFYTNDSLTTGAELNAGSGTWTSVSDRNAKESVEVVQPREVLERVATLPVATWQYKTEAGDVRHMGPMAQDFHEAFGLGHNEISIATVDADGVSLAAIQGLYEVVKEKDARIAELEQRLARLEALVAKGTE